MLRDGVKQARAVAAVAALLLLTCASQAGAQMAHAATPPDHSAISAAAEPQGPQAQAPDKAQDRFPDKGLADKGLAGKAVDRVKDAAKQAGDILTRVPCLPPKGGLKPMGSLPHVANKLISGAPVVIVAFGSSSTQGYGSTSPAFNYPNRLAAQLHRRYPTADISVVNRGQGGEDAPEMMARLKSSVLDLKPDLVIWQVGTNAILRNLDPADTAKMVGDGITTIQAAGADLVLVDPQYAPRVNEKAEKASRMVQLLGRVAELRKVGFFPRFEVMRQWHETQAIPFESFVIADGLHMNDWGYACFAQLLGDDIIRSVGQIKLGVNVPADVRTYRPM